LQFELELEFSKGVSWPVLEFVNGVNLAENLVDQNKKTVNVFLTSDTNIVFKNTNKTSSETIVDNSGLIIADQYVKIKKLWADDILLDWQLILSQCHFKPEYSEDFVNYCHQHSIEIDYNPYPLELYHNGTWSFEFELDFWSWYADLRQQKILKNFSATDIELYFGTDSTERQQSLKTLKDLLNV
jgi:hypothetical protein